MDRILNLRYGQGDIPLTLPSTTTILEPGEPKTKPDYHRLGRELLLHLSAKPPKGQVAIVVADKTRLCGYPTLLPWLVDLLESHGVRKQQIRFFISYGTHARQSEEESLASYGEVYHHYRFTHHQSDDQGQFISLGTTSRQTPIRIRRDLTEAELIITAGAISHHYFAGYGGGRKLLFPGLAETKAIYSNHRLFLDSKNHCLSAGCRAGRLTGNPLATDLKEIHDRLPSYIAIHGLLDSQGQVVEFRVGQGYEDFLDACRAHDHFFRSSCKQKFSFVLASAGGFPKDINFIQAHKAINNSAGFVKDGGRLIVLAQCRDGIGSESFLPYFAFEGVKSAFTSLEQNYVGNGGTALSMMEKTRRIRIGLHSELPRDICERMNVTPLSQDAIQRLIYQHDEAAVIANSSMLIC